VVTTDDSIGSVRVGPGTFDTVWAAAVTSLGERIDAQVRSRALRRDGESVAGAREAAEARRMMASGRYAEAARALEAVVVESPRMAPAWDLLARSHAATGNMSAATGAVERWHDSGAPDAPDASEVQRLEDAIGAEGARGYWVWRLERLSAEEDEGDPVSRTELAAAHAALGHRDEAFRLLDEALDRREPAVLTLRSDPVWDDLRADSRFPALARRAQAIRFSGPGRPPRRDGGGR
jgi:tetratricopeptide (TPR) repeat protein